MFKDRNDKFGVPLQGEFIAKSVQTVVTMMEGAVYRIELHIELWEAPDQVIIQQIYPIKSSEVE